MAFLERKAMKEIGCEDLNSILQAITKFVRTARDRFRDDPECACFFDEKGNLYPNVALGLLLTAARHHVLEIQPDVEIKNGHPDSILYYRVLGGDQAAAHAIKIRSEGEAYKLYAECGKIDGCGTSSGSWRRGGGKQSVGVNQ